MDYGLRYITNVCHSYPPTLSCSYQIIFWVATGCLWVKAAFVLWSHYIFSFLVATPLPTISSISVVWTGDTSFTAFFRWRWQLFSHSFWRTFVVLGFLLEHVVIFILSFSQGESRQNHDVLVASLQFGNDHHWPYNILDENPPINESSPSLPKFPHFILFPCLLASNVSAQIPSFYPNQSSFFRQTLLKTFQADEIRHSKFTVPDGYPLVI